MKIILAGGTGQIGTLLARAFQAEGEEVVILSRSPRSDNSPWRQVPWDAQNLGPWTAELEGADVVFGLAGRSVNCRYSEKNRRLIKDSRTASVRTLGAAIQAARNPPKLWMQASTATIYEHTYGSPNKERSGLIGGNEPDAPETWRFSIEVATAWEQAVQELGTLPKTRTVLLRSAMTMSPDSGGVFSTFLRLVRLGLGGKQGDGRQYVSWIHEHDFVRAMRWIMEHSSLDGAINIAAPEPLPNRDFMQALRQAWGIRFGLPSPEPLLELGAFFLRTETELVLKSRRVVPGRLLEEGFVFRFPSWAEAAQDLCRQWRAENR